MNTGLIVYFTIISCVAVHLTVHDKLAAKKGGERVPEAILMLFAVLGGSLAMYLTMLVVRHKVRKTKFMAGIPAIMVAEAVLGLWLGGVLF